MNGAGPASLEELFALHHSLGHRHYGEGVSADDHARQCAALASADGASGELVIAALFHDAGWYLHDDHSHDDGSVDDDHAAAGARILSPLLGPEVAQPVALHVMAKRWRASIDPDYLDELSATSRATLVAQGGPLLADERARFEAHPGFGAALALRSWDDRAKASLVDTPDVEQYRSLAESIAQRFNESHARVTTGTRSPDSGQRQDGESGARETEALSRSQRASDVPHERTRHGHQSR